MPSSSSSSRDPPPPPPLTHEQIETYMRDGVLVVPNMLRPPEVEEAKRGLHGTLRHRGVDPTDLTNTGRELTGLSSTNGSGGVLDVYYPGWKMKVALNARLWAATRQLWDSAYSHGGERLEDLAKDGERYRYQPYGPFDVDRGYAYIDRIGYRLPTAMAAEIGRRMLSEEEEESPYFE